jgi:hypothetical protein
MFKPSDRDYIHRFLDGDMRHRAVGTRSVPVALPWVENDDIPRGDSFNRTTIALNPAKAIGDEEKLAKRMRMRSVGAGLCACPHTSTMRYADGGYKCR